MDGDLCAGLKVVFHPRLRDTHIDLSGGGADATTVLSGPLNLPGVVAALEEGLDHLVFTRNSTMLSITLSLTQLNNRDVGY